MLAIQLAAKRKQQNAEREAEKENVFGQRAQELGADMSQVRAAQFDRKQRDENFSSPQQMSSIYGSMAGGGMGGDMMGGSGGVPAAEMGAPTGRGTVDDDLKKKLSSKYGYSSW
jgi:hypothetical protein